jgi:hypothetical protein
MLSVPGFMLTDYPLPAGLSTMKSQVNKTSCKTSFYSSQLKEDIGATRAHTYSTYVSILEGSVKKPFYIFKAGDKLWISETLDKVDLNALDCSIKEKTKSSGKKKISFSGKPEIAAELEKVFSGKSFFELKARGEPADIQVDIECGAPKLTISNPLPESQKLACIIAEKMAEIGYRNIRQEYIDSNSALEVIISYNCDIKEAGAIKDALEAAYG